MSNGHGPVTDGQEGLRVLKILNISQRSLDEHGKKIRLDGRTLPEKTPVGPTPGVAPGAFVHATAIVDPGAVVGAGTKIWHFSHVLSGSKVGKRCNIGQNVVVGPDVAITCELLKA